MSDQVHGKVAPDPKFPGFYLAECGMPAVIPGGGEAPSRITAECYWFRRDQVCPATPDPRKSAKEALQGHLRYKHEITDANIEEPS